MINALDSGTSGLSRSPGTVLGRALQDILLSHSLVPRPIFAVRMTGEGLEPSVIARRPAKKWQKKVPVQRQKVPNIARRKSAFFCEDQGIFRMYKLNTSLPNI